MQTLHWHQEPGKSQLQDIGTGWAMEYCTVQQVPDGVLALGSHSTSGKANPGVPAWGSETCGALWPLWLDGKQYIWKLKQKKFGKLVFRNCSSLYWLNETFQLPCSLMREDWIPQKAEKMSFCQFLKAFVLSVKCHLHSAWKHNSEDPAHEHNSSLTFTSEYPEWEGACKDHWSPVADTSLHWASVNCISWCLRQLSSLVRMWWTNPLFPLHRFFPVGLSGNFLTPTLLNLVVMLPSWCCEKLCSAGEMRFDMCSSDSQGKCPFHKISVGWLFYSAMQKGGSANFKSCSLFLSFDTE